MREDFWDLVDCGSIKSLNELWEYELYDFFTSSTGYFCILKMN